MTFNRAHFYLGSREIELYGTRTNVEQTNVGQDKHGTDKCRTGQSWDRTNVGQGQTCDRDKHRTKRRTKRRTGTNVGQHVGQGQTWDKT